MIDQPTMSPPEAALVPGFDQVNRFVALDFEMTGHAMPSVQTLERATRFMKFPGVIIEIGAVAFHRDGASFRRGDIYQTFVNPDGPLNPQASAIHGIKSGQLKTAPRFKHIADTLLAFLADSPIVAHSYKNERDALDYELARAGRQGWRAEWRPGPTILERMLALGAVEGLADAISARYPMLSTAGLPALLAALQGFADPQDLPVTDWSLAQFLNLGETFWPRSQTEYATASLVLDRISDFQSDEALIPPYILTGFSRSWHDFMAAISSPRRPDLLAPGLSRAQNMIGELCADVFA